MASPVCGAYQEALILNNFMRSGCSCAGCGHAHEGKVFAGSSTSPVTGSTLHKNVIRKCEGSDKWSGEDYTNGG